MSQDGNVRSRVYHAAVKRLIAAHPQEWERLRKEEWERLRPGQPSRQRGRGTELPMDRITDEYNGGASLRELAKKYGIPRSTLQAKIPPEVLRAPGGRRKIDRSPRINET